MRIISIIYLLLFTAVNILQCQTLQSTTATASANLILPISVTAMSGQLDFGDIIMTGAQMQASVNPDEGEIFVVTGHPGRNITINFSSASLDNNSWASAFGGISGSLVFNPVVIESNSSPVHNGDSISLNNMGAAGTLTLKVGGIIDIGAEQPQGDYVGLFTMTVSY